VKAHVLLVLERMRMINGCRAYTFWLPPMFYLPSSSSLLPYLVRGKGLYGVGVRWKFCHILLLPLSHVYGWTAWSDGRQPNEVGFLLCVYKPYVIALASPSTLYFQIPIYQISNHRALTNRPARLDITSKCRRSPLGPRTMGNCEISLLLTFPSPFQVSFRPEIG
jgi:hypothetical protein